MGRVVWAYYQLGFSNKFLRSKRRCAVCMCWGKVGLVPWWASTSEMAQLNASHSSSLLSPEHQAARHFPCSQQRLTLCPCQCPDHLNIPLRDILHSQHIHISLTHQTSLAAACEELCKAGFQFQIQHNMSWCWSMIVHLIWRNLVKITDNIQYRWLVPTKILQPAV